MTEIDNTKKIRARKSYKMFKKFFDAGCGRAVLELLHQELSNRKSYGSMKAEDYAKESLDLFIKDHGV
jgi:hypothetical protein